jgi:hypothetical protein
LASSGRGDARVVADLEQPEDPEGPTSAETAATLVWFLESGGVDRRSYTILNRLRRLRDGEQFATLPEDLRERIREILAESPP